MVVRCRQQQLRSAVAWRCLLALGVTVTLGIAMWLPLLKPPFAWPLYMMRETIEKQGHVTCAVGRVDSDFVFQWLHEVPDGVYKITPKTAHHVASAGELPFGEARKLAPGVRFAREWKAVLRYESDLAGLDEYEWFAFDRYVVSLWYLGLPLGGILVTLVLSPGLRSAAGWWFLLLPRLFARRHAVHPDPAFPVITNSAKRGQGAVLPDPGSPTSGG